MFNGFLSYSTTGPSLSSLKRQGIGWNGSLKRIQLGDALLTSTDRTGSQEPPGTSAGLLVRGQSWRSQIANKNCETNMYVHVHGAGREVGGGRGRRIRKEDKIMDSYLLNC